MLSSKESLEENIKKLKIDQDQLNAALKSENKRVEDLEIQKK